MRTTINLDDHLLADLKLLAARTARTMSSINRVLMTLLGTVPATDGRDSATGDLFAPARTARYVLMAKVAAAILARNRASTSGLIRISSCFSSKSVATAYARLINADRKSVV